MGEESAIEGSFAPSATCEQKRVGQAGSKSSIATALVEKGTLVSALSHAVASSTQHQLRNKEEHNIICTTLKATK
eukprot:scaffold32240_cov151-Skeletonema_marinoi.AAC.1